jgi:hypothetical protein
MESRDDVWRRRWNSWETNERNGYLILRTLTHPSTFCGQAWLMVRRSLFGSLQMIESQLGIRVTVAQSLFSDCDWSFGNRWFLWRRWTLLGTFIEKRQLREWDFCDTMIAAFHMIAKEIWQPEMPISLWRSPKVASFSVESVKLFLLMWSSSQDIPFGCKHSQASLGISDCALVWWFLLNIMPPCRLKSAEFPKSNHWSVRYAVKWLIVGIALIDWTRCSVLGFIKISLSSMIYL